MMAYMKSLPESERPQPPVGARPDGMDVQAQGGQMEDMPDNIKRVWVKEGQIIRPVRVETGVTDGSTLQIISGLNEGDEIVLAISIGRDVTENKSDSEETQKSPFVPERPSR